MAVVIVRGGGTGGNPRQTIQVSRSNPAAASSLEHGVELLDPDRSDNFEVVTVGFQILGLLNSLFGDGSDGDHTVAGTETLTRDMYYRDLTVPSGAILQTNGFRVFCSGECNIAAGGTVRNNGANGAAAVGGTGGARGSLGGGSAGGNSGVAGAALADSFGGRGGDSTGTGALANGAFTAEGTGLSYMTLLPFVLTLVGAGGETINGGQGGAGASNAGGGGGGGLVLIVARELILAGTVQANGGNGQTSTGQAGGGGGGFVALAFGTLQETGTVQVNGGTGPQAGAAGNILRTHLLS